MELHNVFNRARIDDRQVSELLGMARAMVADGKIDQSEVEMLQRFLIASEAATENPLISGLLERVNEVLADGVLDREEAEDLFDTLSQLVGGDMATGELLKATTLPLDQPPPEIVFAGRRFCFTGTFAFGPRKECEKAVSEKGGDSGSLTKQTDYLVIGVYATDSWAHSSYGRKIEKAVTMKAKGEGIVIVGEEHWRKGL